MEVFAALATLHADCRIAMTGTAFYWGWKGLGHQLAWVAGGGWGGSAAATGTQPAPCTDVAEVQKMASKHLYCDRVLSVTAPVVGDQRASHQRLYTRTLFLPVHNPTRNSWLQ